MYENFNLEEAAQFLKMSSGGLRRLATSKKIPAAKPGRGWCFLEEDLVNYVRSLYEHPATKYRRVFLTKGERHGTLREKQNLVD